MELTEVLNEPFNYLFCILLFIFIIFGMFITVFKEYLSIIVTVLWVGFGMAAWANDQNSTIWFAGALTWLVWLWEAQKHSSESFTSHNTCPWVAGSDALFWSMSVPLFAIAIGLWSRTFMEDGDQWITFVGVITMGYAAWLTLWRLSSVMPFMQSVRGGQGFGYSPVDV